MWTRTSRPDPPLRHAAVLAVSLVAACGGGGALEGGEPPTEVVERFVVRASIIDNLDSPAVWHGPIGRSWVITTAKTTHRLLVHDAATGALVGAVGRRGGGPAEFRRPNGIAVAGDLLLVVERDNARVQALRLPEFDFVTTFGEGTLRRPYGIAVVDDDAGLDVFITDDYETAGRGATGDRELGERVKHYRIDRAGGGVDATLVRAFGDTVGPGRLRTVESLAVDPEAGLLLIADEAAGDVKVYRVDGTFTGRVLWADVIRHEPEGIALHVCGPGDGYWILADQHRADNRLLVFGRRDFELLGAFTGRTLRNTDGVTVTQRAVGPMGAGALYAVHTDRALAAFSWSDIAAALELDGGCDGAVTGPAPGDEPRSGQNERPRRR